MGFVRFDIFITPLGGLLVSSYDKINSLMCQTI